MVHEEPIEFCVNVKVEDDFDGISSVSINSSPAQSPKEGQRSAEEGKRQ